MSPQDAKPMSQWNSGDHVRSAVALLELATNTLADEGSGNWKADLWRHDGMVAQAQVHATLALALKEEKK